VTTIKPAFEMPAKPAPAAGPVPVVRADQAADAYRKLRDKKSDIKKRHEEELRPINEAMDQLEVVLLDVLNSTGGNSIRTGAGTVFKSTRTTYSVSDPTAFREWVEQQGCPDMFENRVSKEALEAHIANGGTLPPGIKVSSDVTVTVRKS
jgi:hypothetical protein